ncbi:alpha/beta hydrolase, partial [Xanthomonas hortorum pv. vitians]|nr:alpha/beta hydrolase [Xanthomonas hortorum pv. vitians]
ARPRHCTGLARLANAGAGCGLRCARTDRGGRSRHALRRRTRLFNRHLLPDLAIAQDWRVSPMLVPDVACVAPALIVVGDRDMLC